MVSTEAESVQQDADCKKAMGREFKGTGDYAALTLHRAGKLINGLLTEAPDTTVVVAAPPCWPPYPP